LVDAEVVDDGVKNCVVIDLGDPALITELVLTGDAMRPLSRDHHPCELLLLVFVWPFCSDIGTGVEEVCLCGAEGSDASFNPHGVMGRHRGPGTEFYVFLCRIIGDPFFDRQASELKKSLDHGSQILRVGLKPKNTCDQHNPR
jgi:hypothetical protein